MPDEDPRLEFIREGIDAFNRGDLDATLERFHPDVEFCPGILPMMGREPLHGRDDVREFWQGDLPVFLPGFHVEVLDLEPVGDAVIVHARYSARAREGMEIDQVFHSVYRFRDGLIVYLEDHSDENEARAAARA